MNSSTRHFIRHYAEMVLAMVLGMVVLGIPAEMALNAAGSGMTELEADAPGVLLGGMAVIMTIPMVAWMAYRGHGRRANAEMAASMLVPGLGVIALLAAGIATDVGDLLLIEHVVMLPSMLGVMLLRRDEYSSHAHAVTA
jgi:hypothetical protein